eukprot:CAMPEP_0201483022 /NCGR_PEP_ID=MMETSP0151_2-20130828/7263_1 /ASSEMBLY_ACC=CAM_ASM_000257 /TAXON_ID=200890 /ORGANISM="Paramoeba atlantica, Strain 621/1 / CCAP 1560/9" /LENGTH=240 /DNA_ID=CAMNT_0047865977 /DNA_START=49 /DNA_END=771 /DNA_ORIENTATION=+
MTTLIDTMVPYAAEFLGSFYLSLVFSIMGDSLEGPIAIGLCLVCLSYGFGHLSGGHFNPALTLCLLISGRRLITPSRASGFIITQVLGGIFGALFGYIITEHSSFPHVSDHINSVQAFIGESVFCSFLCFVFLTTTSSQQIGGNGFYGLTVGLAYAVSIYCLRGSTGGVLNPAVGTGVLLMSALEDGEVSRFRSFWLYWMAPLFASFIAAFQYRLLNYGKEYREKKEEWLASPPDFGHAE